MKLTLRFVQMSIKRSQGRELDSGKVCGPVSPCDRRVTQHCERSVACEDRLQCLSQIKCEIT
jgi:hypothetical protein